MRSLTAVAIAVAMTLIVSNAWATFHEMEIEEIVGSINGNTQAQAVQLREKALGQNLVSNASLWASDANGANRVLLLNIAANVTNAASGARILLTTSAFTAAMVAGGATTFSPDFTLANSIPTSYLSAGRLTYEDDLGSVASPGTIYWSIAWGGANYHGSNLGSTFNDADGNFGPAFGSALPTNQFAQGIIFTGAATSLSTTNQADYAFTANPATVTKNNGLAFTIVPEPNSAVLLFGGALVLAYFASPRRRHRLLDQSRALNVEFK